MTSENHIQMLSHLRISKYSTHLMCRLYYLNCQACGYHRISLFSYVCTETLLLLQRTQCCDYQQQSSACPVKLDAGNFAACLPTLETVSCTELYALAVTNCDCVATSNAPISTFALIESPMYKIPSVGSGAAAGVTCGDDVGNGLPVGDACGGEVLQV